MSAKLLLHTAFCLGLVCMLALHIHAGRRRVVYSLLLLTTLAAALSPWCYRWFGKPFPRVTLNWAQVMMVWCTLMVFTPGAGRRPEALDSERFDLPATDRAPLEDPRHMYH